MYLSIWGVGGLCVTISEQRGYKFKRAQGGIYARAGWKERQGRNYVIIL